MKSTNKILLLIIYSLMITKTAYGAWQNASQSLSTTWGGEQTQVGTESNDAFDSFPKHFDIDTEGNAIIADLVNLRIVIYDKDGKFRSTIGAHDLPEVFKWWPSQWLALKNGYILIKTGKKYQIYNYEGEKILQFDGVSTNIASLNVLQDNSVIVYKRDSKAYYQYTPQGELFKSSTERPKELGDIKEQSLGEGNYKVIITYPDRTYTIDDGPFEKYLRDSKDYLNAVSGKGVDKFDACGKKLGSVIIPDDQYNIIRPAGGGFDEFTEVVAEYGDAVVGPDGDVYAWKRTPANYSILKWEWVDEATDPKGGPDAPANFKVLPALNGIYLTWEASSQDPGCVTAYELERATTSDGIFSKVTDMVPGVFKYNDETAFSGTTYYYKLKAVAGDMESDYTAEASAAKP